MTEHYVTMKLITGEELIGEVTTQNDYSITLMNPLLVATKLLSADDGRIYEKQTASPYCSYAEDNVFTFELKHILFSKPLKPRVIPTYVNMIHKINMKEMVNEEVNEYLDALSAMVGDTDDHYSSETEYQSEAEEQASEEIEEILNEIQGNRTLH